MVLGFESLPFEFLILRVQVSEAKMYIKTSFHLSVLIALLYLVFPFKKVNIKLTAFVLKAVNEFQSIVLNYLKLVELFY